MSRFRRIDFIDPYCPPLLIRDSSIFESPTLGFPSFMEEVDDLSFPLDALNRSTLDLFDSVTDLIQIEKTPSIYPYKQIRQRIEPHFPLQYLCDRVSTLDRKFDRLVNPRIDGDRKYTWTAEIKGPAERKYKWEAEIEGPSERKYKWMTEIKDGKKKEEHEVVVVKKAAAVEKNYKWTTEIKSERENGKISNTYTFKTSSGNAGESNGKSEKKSKKKEKKGESQSRVVVIEEEEEPEAEDHRAVVLRQAFAKRAGAVKNQKGKNRELFPQDAALMIQMTFRAYLIRRSKALRALRELAVAKTKLKELRASFNNFSYRRLIARDAEERQKFSEKIIVLLLTVDAIEGVELMVRAAKRSMVDELEAMLEVVDPQPEGKSLSMKRRTFDMPDSVIRKEIADGVTQIVQMLETEE